MMSVTYLKMQHDTKPSRFHRRYCGERICANGPELIINLPTVFSNRKSLRLKKNMVTEKVEMKDPSG